VGVSGRVCGGGRTICQIVPRGRGRTRKNRERQIRVIRARPSEDTFRAIGAVVDSDAEIALNLVDIETARPLLRAAIERQGVELWSSVT
jgi:hypothetical protein